MLQQKICKLVSISGKGKFSIFKKNPKILVYILVEAEVSFVWFYKCNQEDMSFLKNSTASLCFFLTKLNILYSVRDLFSPAPQNLLFFIHCSTLPQKDSFESCKT